MKTHILLSRSLGGALSLSIALTPVLAQPQNAPATAIKLEQTALPDGSKRVWINPMR